MAAVIADRRGERLGMTAVFCGAVRYATRRTRSFAAAVSLAGASPFGSAGSGFVASFAAPSSSPSPEAATSSPTPTSTPGAAEV